MNPSRSPVMECDLLKPSMTMVSGFQVTGEMKS